MCAMATSRIGYAIYIPVYTSKNMLEFHITKRHNAINHVHVHADYMIISLICVVYNMGVHARVRVQKKKVNLTRNLSVFSSSQAVVLLFH